MDCGVQSLAAAVCILPVWRRSASLHRRVVRVDGAGARHEYAGATMADAAGARASCRAATGRHPADETWAQDDAASPPARLDADSAGRLFRRPRCGSDEAMGQVLPYMAYGTADAKNHGIPGRGGLSAVEGDCPLHASKACQSPP